MTIERCQVVVEERIQHAQRLETLGSVAAGVAHDLANVLAVIASCANTLEEEVADPELRAEATQIVDSVRHATQFVRSLVAYAKRSPAAPVPVELNAVIAGMMPLLRRMAGSAVTVELTSTTLPTLIVADPSDLEQIVVNLVINARDAMPRGGPVSIATWTAQQGDRDEVILSVADRGVGIDERVRDRIWDPRFTTKSPDQGSGLGLAIVRSLAIRADARVAVASVVGAGTTFELAFPAAHP